jgi:pimeloyl-ACP methyl ester carboxylesterase
LSTLRLYGTVEFMGKRLALVLVVCALVGSGCSGEEPADRAEGESRALVSSEAVHVPEGLPEGTVVHRITYRSTTPSGEHTTVSGITLVPAEPDPDRPVLAWAHGTTGIADDCAPSADPALAGYTEQLAAFLDAGYAVTATDYAGLGTPGDHPYLISESAGRSVVDSVRAIHDLHGDLGDRWVAIGHSQGGHAAIAAAEVADGAELAGVVAYAPAPNMTSEVDRLGQAVPAEQALYTLMLVGLKTQHPELDFADYLGARALELLPVARSACVDELVTRYVEAGLPGSEYEPRNAAAADRLRGWFAENEIARRAVSVPVLVAQGADDQVVYPEYTRALVEQARKQGTSVDYRVYPGAEHGGVLAAAARDVFDWLAGRAA